MQSGQLLTGGKLVCFGVLYTVTLLRYAVRTQSVSASGLYYMLTGCKDTASASAI
jgi:hypothetical protein